MKAATPRNKTEETAFLVQIVLSLCFLVFDFAVEARASDTGARQGARERKGKRRRRRRRKTRREVGGVRMRMRRDAAEQSLRKQPSNEERECEMRR